jgi:tetratricopeptide (TPR) repeat protein
MKKRSKKVPVEETPKKVSAEIPKEISVGDAAPVPGLALKGPAWGWALAAIVLAGLVYVRMMFAGYVWDDTLVQRWQIPFFQTFRDAFFPSQHIFELTRSYYRPMVPLTYMLDRSIAGSGMASSAAWAHSANILYHMAATALVFALARRFFRGTPNAVLGSLLAAGLFAVHPIHAESVCNIAGRTDILATIFVLGSVVCALQWRDAKKWGWGYAVLSAFLVFLGMLSKEIALSALVLIPLVLWFFPKLEGEGADRKEPQFSVGQGVYAALLLSGIFAYFWLRKAAGCNFGEAAPVDFGRSLLNLFAALGYYVRKVLFPWPQYHYMPKLPELWLSVLVLVLVSTVTAWAFWAARKSRNAIVLALIWFAVGIAPSLMVAIRMLAVTPVAERYLYLPSVGVCLLAGHWAALADWRQLRTRIAAGCLGVLLVAFSASVIERTGVWQADVAFWEDAIRNPDAAVAPLVLSNLGEAYQQADRPDIAKATYAKAVALMTNPIDQLKVKANLAAMELTDSQRALSVNNLKEALAHADTAISYLEPVLVSPLRMDGIPNASMGISLLVKAKVEGFLSGNLNRSILERARYHLDLAKKTIRDNPDLNGARAECERLLMSNQAR